MSNYAIEINNLQKDYVTQWGLKRVPAVKDLTLSIKSGEIWALVGPNGAGKSTTLYCLTGLFHPDKGSIKVFGYDPREPEARRSLGFQSEVFYTYPYRTAEQVLRFYGKLHGMPKLELEQKVQESLTFVNLAEARQLKTGTFSKGMMQRLGLAQSLLHDPQLIIWDEPSTGLDPEGRRLVIDLLIEMKKKGKTVVFSTHILSDIEKVCDHIAIIDKGKILTSGVIQDLMQERQTTSFEDVYLHYIRGKVDVA